jgi:hypothetical protein
LIASVLRNSEILMVRTLALLFLIQDSNIPLTSIILTHSDSVQFFILTFSQSFAIIFDNIHNADEVLFLHESLGFSKLRTFRF